jgi:hypothetical protein
MAAEESACFTQALSEVLALSTLNDDWATYRHVSDVGIATEAYQLAYGVDPTPELLEATITRFVELLAIAHGTEQIAQVAGARHLFTALPQHGWAVAMATGAAVFKLAAASLSCDDVPIATAEDGPTGIAVNSAAARSEGPPHRSDTVSRTPG